MCRIQHRLSYVDLRRLIASILALLLVMCCPVSLVWAMSMEEACGNATESLMGVSQGRWLPWTNDHIEQAEVDTAVINVQQKLLTELAEPFMQLNVLKPPAGVEARPHRVLAQRLQMGEPVAGAQLVIQLFHPTYKEAGESTAGVKLFVNNLLPLF